MFRNLKFARIHMITAGLGGLVCLIVGLAGCGHGVWDMKVLLDNDAVQILEVDFKAGSKTPRHYHREAFIYALSEAKLRITGSNGKPLDIELKPNQVLWRDAEMRTLENIGNTDFHVLNFDLKKPPKSQTVVADLDPLTLSTDSFSLLMDNRRIRVLDAQVKAGIRIPAHAHPDSVLYFLSDARLKFTFADGKSKEIVHKKGDALWLPAQSHVLETLGDTAVRFLVVEFKPAA